VLTGLIVVVALAGVVFAVRRQNKVTALATAGDAPLACPACNNFFTGRSTDGAIVRCAECGAYSRVAGGVLGPIADDFVATAHAFETFLPEAPRWPACCCVCGGAATRGDKMSITFAAEPTFEEKLTAHAVVNVASLGTMRVAEHRVNVTERYTVPHCDEHSGGAQLAPAGIAFRSYPYFRKFVQANRATIA
jgi:ribosomal protein L37AE/L43A